MGKKKPSPVPAAPAPVASPVVAVDPVAMPPAPPPNRDRWYARLYQGSTHLYQELKGWFLAGRQAMPAFRYIQVLMAIGALIAIVLFFFKLPIITAVIGTLITLGLGVCVVLFADVARRGGPKNWLAWVVYGFMALAFMLVIGGLVSWFLFGVPSNIGHLLGAPTAGPDPVPIEPPALLSTLPDTTTLPEDVFGKKNDPAKGRQWEKYLTFGFHFDLNNDPVVVYLVTQPFPAPRYKGFTLHVNVNTTDKVLPLVFLARPEADQVLLMPLQQADHRQGPRWEYRYTVPATNRENDRLLVILAMQRDTYDRIKQTTKFVLSSQPLSQ